MDLHIFHCGDGVEKQIKQFYQPRKIIYQRT